MSPKRMVVSIGQEIETNGTLYDSTTVTTNRRTGSFRRSLKLWIRRCQPKNESALEGVSSKAQGYLILRSMAGTFMQRWKRSCLLHEWERAPWAPLFFRRLFRVITAPSTSFRRALIGWCSSYPKSKADQLYYDSIEIEPSSSTDLVPFEAFIGVGPRRFFDLFSMRLSSGRPTHRKDSQSGKALEPRAIMSVRTPEPIHSLEDLEITAANKIDAVIKGMKQEEGHSDADEA